MFFVPVYEHRSYFSEMLAIVIFMLYFLCRPYHPHNIFTWMKEIMTRLIEGSDEISVELLQLLLDRVKIDNQVIINLL